MNKTYDSSEEQYFAWYLDELVDAGYVKEYELHPKSFTLSDKCTIQKTQQLKTKTKVIEKTFLQGHIYTPDYMVRWENNAQRVLFSTIKGGAPFWLSGYNFSYIEIKPTFSRYNMARAFSINQKWMYNKHGIYVQLIRPSKLFKDTFTPVKYLTTDKSNKPRRIAWNVLSLEEYINQKESL